MPIMSEEFVRQTLGNLKQKMVAYQDDIDTVFMDSGQVKINLSISAKQISENKIDIDTNFGVSKGKIGDKSKWSMDNQQMTLLDAVPAAKASEGDGDI